MVLVNLRSTHIYSVVNPMFPAHTGLGLEYPGSLPVQPGDRLQKARLSLSGEEISLLKVSF